MASKIIVDNMRYAVDGIDRHYYEKQVPRGSPLDETYPFRLAAARAKDRARHNLVLAVRRAADEAHLSNRRSQSVGQELGGILSGHRMQDEVVDRRIDGMVGAPDDAIKL